MDQNWTQKLPFYNNRVLFGHDATPGLIAFEIEGPDKVKIFSRQGGATLFGVCILSAPFAD